MLQKQFEKDMRKRIKELSKKKKQTIEERFIKNNDFLMSLVLLTKLTFELRYQTTSKLNGINVVILGTAAAADVSFQEISCCFESFITRLEADQLSEDQKLSRSPTRIIRRTYYFWQKTKC